MYVRAGTRNRRLTLHGLNIGQSKFYSEFNSSVVAYVELDRVNLEVVDEVPGKAARGWTACQNDAVPRIGCPLDKQVTRKTTFQVRNTHQDCLYIISRQIHVHKQV